MASTRKILVEGGPVFTSDPARPWAQAVVIDGDRIGYVGDAPRARDLAGPDCERIDLKGGVAMPGFVDAHAHLLLTGAALLKAQLRTAKSVDEIRSRLVEWRKSNPTAPRVLGIGWQFYAIPNATPNKSMLDDLFPDVPVYLDPFDLHSCWVNSAALRELGITKDTKDPIGGTIVRDPETGEATGYLLENATFFMVWPLLANVDVATADRQLASCFRAYNETGVTSAVDMAFDTLGYETVKRALDSGSLTVRVRAHWFMRREEDPAAELVQVEKAAEMAARTHGDLLKVMGIKIMVDGTIDGCTAALLEPYTNGTNADPIWDADSLKRVLAAADAKGLQIALHAIGDRAIRIAIDALEHAAKVNGTSGRRHRIEHLEYTDEADVVRLAPLGITASMQPVHIDPAVYSNWGDLMGDPRAQRGFAWREFVKAGATLAFGTDTPTAPHLPLHNMYIAATRKSPGDPTLKPHRPDFALPLEEAVVHGTRDAAWASFLQDKVGMLKEGMLADLIVLDRDPFGADPTVLLSTEVVRTVLGGRTVHERSASGTSGL